MTRGHIHIVGAGLAGLAAALHLRPSGYRLTIHEAAGHAGGRCRSYFDAELGRRIDNGNHLLVGANKAAMAYIAEIGAGGEFVAAERAEYPFRELPTGPSWTLRPNDGAWPWWVFCRDRRVADSRPLDYYRDWRRLRAAPETARVAECLDRRSPLYRRFWTPLCAAALNTEPEAASAKLLANLFAETFLAGGAGLRPLLPRVGLSESLIDPALAKLMAAGVEIRFGRRLRAFEFAGEDRIAALDFGRERIDLAPEDRVILAVPAPIAAELLPGLVVPRESRAILNAHFAVEALPDRAYTFRGLIGGLAEWIFLKPGIIATTTSAADPHIDQPAEILAERLWHDIVAAYALSEGKMPPWRVVKEKRATFAAIPSEIALRPGNATRWRNLVLAGDWVATGWPATIESAIRSGFAAARAIKAR